MDDQITLELKKKDYDKLYKSILKSRDDDYIPKKNNKIEYYEFHEDESEPEFEVSIDSDGFWSIK